MSRLSPNQYRIYDWILNGLSLPVFAEVYKGAALAIKRKTAGYITFSSHAGRDLLNYLVSSYKGEENGGQVPYSDLVDEVNGKWLDEWGVSQGTAMGTGEEGVKPTGPENKYRAITLDVCISIQKLLQEHRAGSDRSNGKNYAFFKEFLRCDDLKNISEDIAPLIPAWKKARRWFQAHTHIRKKDFSSNAPMELKEHFSIVEKIFYKAATYTKEKYEKLNNILQKANN